MKYPTIGMLLLLGVCWIQSIRHPSYGRELGFGALFTVLMYATVALGRFCEWWELRKLEKQFGHGSPRVRLFAAIAALWFALKAKAIILFAVVALGLGLIAWGVIELVYDAMTVVPRIQRNDLVRVTVTERPQIAARPVRLISATPFEIHESDPDSPWMYRKVNGTKPLDYSTDGVNWQPWKPTDQIGQGLWMERE